MGRRVLVGLLAATVSLSLALTGCGGTKSGAGAAKEPIKIGAVISLTGPYAGLGAPEKAVFDMEAARINAAGGINGRKVEVLIEDDGTDEAKAVATATKLIEKEKVVAVLGASGTGQSVAMRTVVDRNQVPMISMAGGTAVMVPFDKWVFQTPWPNRLVVPFVLKYMSLPRVAPLRPGRGAATTVGPAGNAPITKIAVLSDTGGYGKDGHEVILATAKKFGLTIVKDEFFNPGDTDMTGQLTKIKSSGAQAILLWSAVKDATTVAKNREQLGIKIPMFGGSGQARMEFIKGAGKVAEGFRFGTGKELVPSSWGTGSPEYKVAKEFSDGYAAKFGDTPDIFAGHAYDAFYLTIEAAKRLPADFTRAQLRDEIEKTKGWIGMDGVFTFTAKDHNGLSESDLAMYDIRNGKWVLLTK